MITNKSIKKFSRSVFYVYKITNPAGEFYIGLTSDVRRRMDTYSGSVSVFKKQVKLLESVNKWGWSKHKWQVLGEVVYEDKKVSTMELKTIEQDYIFKNFIMAPDKCLNIVIWGQPRHYIQLSNEVIDPSVDLKK